MVRIGIADSGVDPSALGAAKVTDWKDFAGSAGAPVDPDGHGTRVAAIVEDVVARVAPGEAVELAVAKVFGEEPADLAAAVDWLAGRGVAAANFSLGYVLSVPALGLPTATLPSEVDLGRRTAQALQRMHARGTVPVVAGGNGQFNSALAPNLAFLGGLSDLPWVLAVGWPMLTTGVNTDVVEAADAGSSFSAPQAAAKAALVNRVADDADLTMEALMATAAPEGSEPPVVPGSAEVGAAEVADLASAVLRRALRAPAPGPLDPAAARTRAALASAEAEVRALLTRPGYSCAAPGRCGWGYPRVRAALDYVRGRRAPEWFAAGEVPQATRDPRWAAWAPGYAVRLRHAAYAKVPDRFTLLGATGRVEDSRALGGSGLVLATGLARAELRTPLGVATLQGCGPVGPPPGRDGLHVGHAAVPLGAWLGNGRWVAVTPGAPTGLAIRWQGQEARPGG